MPGGWPPKRGLTPTAGSRWRKSCPLLRYRTYYQNTEQGFCRGDITVAYVKHILIYYDILKRQELDAAVAKVNTTNGNLGRLKAVHRSDRTHRTYSF